jgi:hypothetical protein
VHFLGTRGRIEIEIPFNAPIDRPTRLFVDATASILSTCHRTHDCYQRLRRALKQQSRRARQRQFESHVPSSLQLPLTSMKSQSAPSEYSQHDH